jgi:ribosomal protein S6--L-glutamate ligase
VGGLPCVVKTPYGSQGTGVIKMENYQQTKATLELLHSRGIDTLLQQYIEGGGKDYRVIVVNDKVVCVMERSSADGFKANLSQSGSGKSVTLSEEHKAFCVRASKAISLDFSGVDIMISNKDGKAYLIEINSNPGVKSIDICKHNWFEDWVKFLETKNHKRLASNAPDLSTKSSTMWYNVGYNEGINGHACNIPTIESNSDIDKSNYVLGWELGRKSFQK